MLTPSPGKGIMPVLILLFAATRPISADSVTQKWAVHYNGPGNGVDEACAIAVDGSGNVFVTGSSQGSGTGCDYATVCYDSDGEQIWVARYNGPDNGYDSPSAIAVDGSGNVYVTGRSMG